MLVLAALQLCAQMRCSGGSDTRCGHSCWLCDLGSACLLVCYRTLDVSEKSRVVGLAYGRALSFLTKFLPYDIRATAEAPQKATPYVRNYHT